MASFTERLLSNDPSLRIFGPLGSHIACLEEEDFPRLLSALRRSQVVTMVDLTDCQSGNLFRATCRRWIQTGRGQLLAQRFADLFNVVANMSSLECLWFGVAGCPLLVDQLVDALSRNTQLRQLLLFGNEFLNGTAEELAQAIRSRPTIDNLSIMLPVNADVSHVRPLFH